MSPPRAAPHRAAAGRPRGLRLIAVGAASSPWKAPSWGNRGARGDRIAWTASSGAIPPGLGKRWRVSHSSHRLTSKPVNQSREAKTNAVSKVSVLHTEFLTVPHPLQRGVPASRPRTAWSSTPPAWSSRQQTPLQRGVPPPPAWSSRQQTPLQRGVPRLQRGVPASRPRTAWSSAQRGVPASRPRFSVEFASRPRYSVEFRAYSVEFPPADPAQRGVPRPQRGVPASRPRYSVEFRGYSVEFPPTDPATAWSSHQQTPPAWSSAATAWTPQRGVPRLQRGVPQQTPPQRGVPRLQRGVPASRPRHSVESRGYSVEFPPADPATAWSPAATAWSSHQQTPPAWSPAATAWSSHPDPATAWSSAATAWSSRQQTPLQRGVPRLQRGVHASTPRLQPAATAWSSASRPALQRGVPASRPRHSVEFRGYSVEFTPTDPATAWSPAATAWSSRQQTPPQRGVPRLQRGVHASRPRHSVEFRGYSVEFTPTDPATAWSCPRRTPSSVEFRRYSVEFRGSSVEFPPTDPATAWSARLQRGVPTSRPATAWSSPAGPPPAWSPR